MGGEHSVLLPTVPCGPEAAGATAGKQAEGNDLSLEHVSPSVRGLTHRMTAPGLDRVLMAGEGGSLGRVGPGFCRWGPSRCSVSPQLPWVCEEGSGTPVIFQGRIDCGSLLGYRAVYRMCFATAAFFFLFALFMICVRSSRDPRAAVQNG